MQVGLIFLRFSYQNNIEVVDFSDEISEMVISANETVDFNDTSLFNIISEKEEVFYEDEKYDPTDVFFDDFDGDSLNLNYWTKVNKKKNYNNELQEYAQSNITIKDGCLVFTAENENNKYKSGQVNTQSKIEFLYGTIEVRLKYPEGRSFFPAVWLLPTNGKSFPETDVFEVVGHHPEKVYFAHHYYLNEKKQKSHDTVNVENYLDYHIYELKWEPDRLTWHIDGIKAHSTTKGVSDVPMYLIMNFAIGGMWPGDPDENTVFPSDVLIDYVKITPYDEKDKSDE